MPDVSAASGDPAISAEATPARPSFAFHQAVTLASLIVGYVGYYLCRANFSAAHDSLHRELQLSDEQFGAIASFGTGVYAVGKVFGGLATDAFGGRRLFFVGLFGSALATVGFGATGGIIALFAFWGLNRAFQSFGWGGLMSVLSRWFTPAEYGTASGLLSVSYQVGGVVATLFAGALLKFGVGWRTLFFAPALLLTALGAVLLLTLKASPMDVGHPVPVERDEKPQPDASNAPLWPRLVSLLGNVSFLMVCALSFVLTFIRETFNTWLPAFFSRTGATSYNAVFKSALFPLLGCLGTILAGWLSDRYFRHNRGPILVGFLSLAGCVLWGLGHPDLAADWGRQIGLEPAVVAAVLVGLTGFFILAPYSMVGGGVFALDYGGRGAAGTAAGLLDSVGYVGGMLAGYGVAQMVKAAHGSWDSVFSVMTWAVFASAALSVVLTVMSPKRAESGG
jgi:sugar phosphate permease